MLTISPPHINSTNIHDIMLDGQPLYGPRDIRGVTDAEWGTLCLITRQFMRRSCVMMTGGVVGYKANMMPTVVMSLTKLDFM